MVLFIAANHFSYGRYIRWCVQERLDEEADVPWLLVYHGCHYNIRLWNGVSSDQFGVTLVMVRPKEDQTAGSVLPYHFCNILNYLMDNMFSDKSGNTSGVHKEEGLIRRKRDDVI